MPTRSSKRKLAKEPQKTLDKQKGDLLEDIAASLHRIGGVRAEARRFLPSRRDPSDKREIDVLLTVGAGIHLLQFGVECKNWKGRVDPDDIGAFKDKLEDVGLPVRPSYYVCVNGYTSGARRRAEEHGIELFTLEGLDGDRMASKIHEAMQLLVFYLCWVEAIGNVDDQPGGLEASSFEYYGPNHKYLGTAADVLWHKWIAGEIPLAAGGQVVDLQLPEGTYHLANGQKTPVHRVLFSLMLQGNVLSVPGTARHHVLRTEADKQVRVEAIEAEFGTICGNPTLKKFEDDEKLREYVGSRGLVKVEGRIRVPRIVLLRRMYWPLSRRVAQMLKRDMDAVAAGRMSNMPDYRFEEVEGTALVTAWEPIWTSHFEGGEPIGRLDEEDEMDNGDAGLSAQEPEV